MEVPVKNVVAHVDLDCFYAAVERERDPTLIGKPVGVVQYNPYGDLRTIKPEEDRRVNDSNGSLIAVSYEARAQGVKRVMRGDEARGVCPELALVQVPTSHGKADLTIYREAGSRVLEILARWGRCERASIDESYLDLTEKATELLKEWGEDVIERASRGTRLAGMEEDTGPVLTKEDLRNGHELQIGAGYTPGDSEADWWRRPPESWSHEEKLLVCGAALVADMRRAVTEELGYTCSAGIAPNKLLSKLSSGLNKPNAQTLVLPDKIENLLAPLPVSRIKGLGGDLGAKIKAAFNVDTLAELWAIPMTKLEQLCGQSSAQWVWRISRGMDDSEVADRKLPKSLSCGKTFYGQTKLRTLEVVKTWLFQLAGEVTERLQADARSYNRLPQQLTVSFNSEGTARSTQQHRHGPSSSSSSSSSTARGGQERAPQHVSRSHALHLSLDDLELRIQATQETLTEVAFALVRKWHKEQQSVSTTGAAGVCITTLFLGVGNFLPITQRSRIGDFFKPTSSSGAPSSVSDAPPTQTAPPRSPAAGAKEGEVHEGSGKKKAAASPFHITLPPPPPPTSSDATAVKDEEQKAEAPSMAVEPARAPPSHPKVTPPTRTAEKRKRGGIDQYLKKTGGASSMTDSSPQGAGPPPSPHTPSQKAAGEASGSSSNSFDGLDVGDIDSAVLAELPESIRQEIMTAMQASSKHHKEAAAKKKGTLESFFGKRQKS